MNLILTESDRNNFREVDDITILDFTDFKVPADIFAKSDRVLYCENSGLCIYIKHRFENNKVRKIFIKSSISDEFL